MVTFSVSIQRELKNKNGIILGKYIKKLFRKTDGVIIVIKVLVQSTVKEMFMYYQNICKFITPKDQGQLIATNFIFESKVPNSGETCCFNKHVLYLVAGGEGRYESAGHSYQLAPGMVVFSMADIPFMIKNTNQLRYYYITFHGGRAGELFQRFGVTPKNCIFEGHEGLLPLWQESLVRADEKNIDLLSESLLLYTFSKLKKADQKDNDIVSFVLNYMEEHFTEHTLCLSSMAAVAGYHEKYLSHTFKKKFGMGFSEYLRLLRIKYAVMLIENGVTSVKNVAILSGFNDPLYFSKVFTEVVGVSPRQYRKKDLLK